ncbi:MAG: hypothetical protein QGI45_04380, partial [Myxococcota bacterium]|nr:hypothetical protein [Myxococcota bacterium]
SSCPEGMVLSASSVTFTRANCSGDTGGSHTCGGCDFGDDDDDDDDGGGGGGGGGGAHNNMPSMKQDCGGKAGGGNCGQY